MWITLPDGSKKEFEAGLSAIEIAGKISQGLKKSALAVKINDEVNELAGESGATSGGLVFLFSLITCGIYGLYWMYKMGERCDTIKGSSGSTGILYLILALLGFGIINYCLMQDTINKAVS